MSVKGSQIVTVASEIVGYKSGLALSRDQMVQLLDDAPSYQRMLQLPDDEFFRIRSEEFEGLITGLLYKIGSSDTPDPGIPLLVGSHGDDPVTGEMAIEIAQIWVDHMWSELDAIKAGRAERMINPRPFLDQVLEKYGPTGAEIALRMVKDVIGYSQRSPWSDARSVEWKDTANLDELFESENLAPQHGKYFDQRFVNYLHQNFDDLDKINWRKFEGLAGEYLERSGFKIDMGPGRNDGSIDIRAWAKDRATELPPTMLVQCKREKKKVGKVVVKALWADIHDEGAQSGLVVTSNALAPGAEQVCQARSYPIEQANRATLRKWVEAMRTPGSGVFLGE
jgi:restriction system protein